MLQRRGTGRREELTLVQTAHPIGKSGGRRLGGR